MLSRTRALRGLRKELERDCLSFSIAQAIRMHFYSEVHIQILEPIATLTSKGLPGLYQLAGSSLAYERTF